MGNVKNFEEYIKEAKETAEIEEPKSEVQAEVRAKEKTMPKRVKNKYQEFFSAKLKKYGSTNIGGLGDKRSQFFKEIKTDCAIEKEKIAQK